MESILQNAAMSQLEIAQRLKQNLTEKHNLMFQNVLHFFSTYLESWDEQGHYMAQTTPDMWAGFGGMQGLCLRRK